MRQNRLFSSQIKITMATATIKLEFNAGDNIEGAFKEAI